MGCASPGVRVVWQRFFGGFRPLETASDCLGERSRVHRECLTHEIETGQRQMSVADGFMGYLSPMVLSPMVRIPRAHSS